MVFTKKDGIFMGYAGVLFSSSDFPNSLRSWSSGIIIWVLNQKMGENKTHQNGWWKSWENHIKMDDLGG